MVEIDGQMELPIVEEWAQEEERRAYEREAELERVAEARLRAAFLSRLEHRHFIRNGGR